MKTIFVSALTLFAMSGVATAQDMKMGGQPADKANMDAMKKMQSAMPTKGSGDPDKDFVMMMIPHHQGAIDMAKVEMQYGKNPTLKKMAAKMVKDQEREITQMIDQQKKLEK
jgi:uncharacterized protein (DUF305 family)